MKARSRLPEGSLLKRPKRIPKAVDSTADLRELQRTVASIVCRPLAAGDRMQRTWIDGRPLAAVARRVMRKNERLSAFERLEIYNRMYWFRVLDSIEDDCPGLHALLGPARFRDLVEAYLTVRPSRSYTLRDLCVRLPAFIASHPDLTRPHTAAARDMARLEWARICAFDAATLPPITAEALRTAVPSRLRLRLQPHLSLLQLRYAVDEFLLGLGETQPDRKTALESGRIEKGGKEGEAAAELKRGGPGAGALPARQTVYLAVHRSEGKTYYKRLDRQGFRLLRALGTGRTLAQACAVFEAPRADPAAGARALAEHFKLFGHLGWLCPLGSKPVRAT